MVAEIYAYLLALIAYWWTLVPGGFFAVDSAAEYFIRGYRRWLDRFVSRELRQRTIFSIALLGVFAAGFLAWLDEHMVLLELKKNSVANIEPTVNIFYPPDDLLPIGKEINFLIEWKNVGNRPALNGFLHGTIYLLPDAKEATQEKMISEWENLFLENWKARKRKKVAPLFPNSQPRFTRATGPVLTSELANELVTQKKFLFLIGSFRFQDDNGEHEARFCNLLVAVMSKRTAWESCTDHISQVDIIN